MSNAADETRCRWPQCTCYSVQGPHSCARPPHSNPELARMDADLDALDQRRIFASARRMSARRHLRSPNWVFAMDLFGIGSTYAWSKCRRMGVDPEGAKADLVHPASPPAADLTHGATIPARPA